MNGGRGESASIAGIVDADDCPDCDGSGVVVWPDGWRDDCDTCGGDGMVAA